MRNEEDVINTSMFNTIMIRKCISRPLMGHREVFVLKVFIQN